MSMIIDILKIQYNSQRWEDRFGATTGSTLLGQYYYEPESRDPTIQNFFWNEVRSNQVNRPLVDSEFRVRSNLGILLR